MAEATGKGAEGRRQDEVRCCLLPQLFNGHLALQPHLHLLAAEGVWHGGAFVALPPPDENATVVRRLDEEHIRAAVEDLIRAGSLEAALSRVSSTALPRMATAPRSPPKEN